MKTQPERLAELLTRPQGATAMEICRHVGTVSPHRRLTDMTERGWRIKKIPVAGKNYHKYFGIAPKAKTRISAT